MIHLERSLCFLDTETTGTDPVKDRIVELAAVVLNPGGTSMDWSKRFNPGIPIPASATATHGITDADVAGCPLFSEYASKIWRALQGKDLAGYNVRRFDLPIIDEELRRSGLRLDLTGVRVIDCAGIFFKKEPRTLEDAVRRYAPGYTFDPHRAAADALASMEVLKGQLAAYQDLAAMNLDALASWCKLEDLAYVDLGCKLYRDADGDLRFAFGKCKDQKVRNQLGYASWMVSKDFPGSTIDALKVEMARVSPEHDEMP